MAGILVLLLSLSILSVLDASGKWMLETGTALLVVVWVRYLVHFLLVMTLLAARGDWHLFVSANPRYQWLRGGTILLTTMSFFTTLSYLPQAQATTMLFLAPLLILALAPWLLGETKRWSRWLAAGVGFMGVMVVVRPGAGLDAVGVMFGLLTAALMAIQHLLTRKVAIDHPLTTIVWSGLIGAVVLSLIVPVWLVVDQTQWEATLPLLSSFNGMILLSMGVTGLVGHLLQVQAYRLAAASLLAPFMYLQIVSASLMGWLIWGDFPDLVSWLGIALICASGAGIALYEWRTAPIQTVCSDIKRPA
jgi:drug/metabolite transporter (DMT)-like permease